MNAVNPMKTTRLSLGLTQVEMAKRLGVSQPTIARLESKPEQLDERTKLALKALTA